jgi:transcriptional regulator with XRE-family HTH domain
LKLQTLVAGSAQLAPLPGGRPAGANLILTAEAGRGKNYICDAVATGLPEDFFLAFESATARSLYYRAEDDSEVLKHRWIYPNEAEGTDELVEMFRPLLSGGKASHLTVNKTGEGRNAAQELNVEGPISLTIPTVRNKLDTQLQTRMLVSELPDYEGRVAEHSRAVSRQLLPDSAGENHELEMRAWRAALMSLTAIRRVVFDLDREEFCFDSDQVSHGARLWANLLGLMLTHAWLEQRNREIVELSSGERAVVATADDYSAAYNVFKATCERSVVNLSDTHRKILTAVYELKGEKGLAEGFSQRKIAARAEVSVSTVSEHKTYLTKSVKLLREADEGLALVADAEPSWWEKEDLLLGFPRPEQVRAWWEEAHSTSGPEIAERAEQGTDEAQNALGNVENGVRRTVEHPPNGAEHLIGDGRSPGGVWQETVGARQETKHENGLGKRESMSDEQLFGMFGGFEDGDRGRDSCIHSFAGGKGCYLCDPNHPHRLKRHTRVEE